MMRRRYSVVALTFEYHQIAREELRAAGRIAAIAEVQEHRVVRLPDMREASDIPGFHLGGLPPTYVPMRNSIFYSFASSIAEEIGATAIIGGHNKDDANVFADVGPGFFRPFEEALRAGSPALRKRRLKILRPLETLTKEQVLKKADSIGVPLGLTWSCHGNGEAHCWECEGCRGRAESFAKAGLEDPLKPPRGKIT